MMQYDQWQSLKYDESRDLCKYVMKHEEMAEDMIDGGEDISDKRRVFQLHMSLPSKYDSALEFYKNLEDPEERTYEAYRRKLLEKHDRILKMDRRRDFRKNEERNESSSYCTYNIDQATASKSNELAKVRKKEEKTTSADEVKTDGKKQSGQNLNPMVNKILEHQQQCPQIYTLIRRNTHWKYSSKEKTAPG